MSFFNNKNFPFFNHKDTFLLKSPIKVELSPKTKDDLLQISLENSNKKACFFTPKISDFNRFCQSPKPNEEKNNLFPEISHKKRNFQISDKSQKFSLHFSQKTQNSQIKSEFFDEKTQDFLQHLSLLRSSHAKTTKKPLISSLNPKNPPDFQSNLSKKLNQIQRKKLVEKPQIPTLNSLSSNLNSSTFIAKKRKRGSLSLDSNSRVYRVQNYSQLQEIVIKVSKNLINLIKIVSNEKKAYNIINEMLENRTKYLKKLFFIEEKKVFQENLNVSSIENACFSKGSSFNVINNLQIYDEKLISCNIIQDLWVFNEKIESYLCERNVKEMTNMA